MILVIDLCYREDSLSREEFVAPIERLLGRSGREFAARHYKALSATDIAAADGAILCGTALMDTGFAERPDLFCWLLEFERPVLGISSGCGRSPRRLAPGEPGCGIGMTEVEVLAPIQSLPGRGSPLTSAWVRRRCA